MAALTPGVRGSDAQTIEDILEAAASGEITLPPVANRTGERFRTLDSPASGGVTVQYTAESLAQFLGGEPNWSKQRVDRCLQVIDTIGVERRVLRAPH
jgi:hypothetical protein